MSKLTGLNFCGGQSARQGGAKFLGNPSFWTIPQFSFHYPPDIDHFISESYYTSNIISRVGQLKVGGFDVFILKSMVIVG